MDKRRIPYAEDVFSGHIGGGSDVKSHVYKKKMAPGPPSGPLPKIGSYQPKSLAAVTPGGPAPELTESRHDTIAQGLRVPEPVTKQYIIGDKDTPLKIEIMELEDQPVAPPRRKRQAPSVPNDDDSRDRAGSDNPVFGRSISNVSSERDLDNQFAKQASYGDFSNVSTNGTIEPDYDEQGGDIDFGIDFGIGIDDEPMQRQSADIRHVTAEVHQNGDSDYPYIPPPDYDAAEYTFNFEEEEEKHIYKEYAGEDFGKYLDDDEDYRVNARRRGMHGGTGLLHMGTKASHQPRAQGKKYKKKSKQPEVSKRNTIRDFTFTDTKIGWGDRTVKSTSAKGRYIKREKERNRIDSMEPFTRAKSQGPGSYEDFLLGNKGAADSPNSSDSGVDTGEDLMSRSAVDGEYNRGFVPERLHERAHSEIFLHSQPKQMHRAMDKHAHKPSIWKRLTWKFKKSVNITTMDER